MKTRRSSAGPPLEAAVRQKNKGGVKKPAARKPAAQGKSGALVQRRVVLRKGGKGSRSAAALNQQQTSAAAAASPQADDLHSPEDDDQEDQGGQGRRGQQQQQAAAAGALKRARRSSAAACGGGGGDAVACITGLSTQALQEIFLQLCRQEQQAFCREVLPLVCKRFRDVLLEPSATLHVDFLQKGLDLALPAQQPGDGGDAGDGSNRRLLHTALERWLKPRAASVKRLVLSASAQDTTHSFAKGGQGLRPVLGLLSRTLQELSIERCSDIFHATSFAQLAQLQSLESLAVTFMQGRVAAADLVPLEGLRRLRSLTLSAEQAEEGGEACMAGFPEPLLKLKGLTHLSISSRGIANIPAGITRLKQLACLDVSGCPLVFLPSPLWKLAALRHLRCNGTNLMVGLAHTWEPIGKLPALESLELRDVKAQNIPVALTGLTSLTSLDLSDNPFDMLSAVEESALEGLDSLPWLKRLALRGCHLPSMPGELCFLGHLTHLDLSNNQLVELPCGLSDMESLRELVAQSNCFPRIPEVVGQLPVLETADLSYNIYMEACVSLAPLLEERGLWALRQLDLRKVLGVWKESSKRWLVALQQGLAERHAECARTSPHDVPSVPVVLWD